MAAEFDKKSSIGPRLHALDCEFCGASLSIAASGRVEPCIHCGKLPVRLTEEGLDAAAIARILKAPGAQTKRDWVGVKIACSECGASEIIALTQSSTRCTFCSSQQVNATKGDFAENTPQFFLPPVISKSEAETALKQAVQTRALESSIVGVPWLMRRAIRRDPWVSFTGSRFLPVIEFRLRFALALTEHGLSKLNSLSPIPRCLQLDPLYASGITLFKSPSVAGIVASRDSALAAWDQDANPDFSLWVADIPALQAWGEVSREALILTSQQIVELIRSGSSSLQVRDLRMRMVGLQVRQIALPFHVFDVGPKRGPLRIGVSSIDGQFYLLRRRKPRQRNGPGPRKLNDWSQPEALALRAIRRVLAAPARLARWAHLVIFAAGIPLFALAIHQGIQHGSALLGLAAIGLGFLLVADGLLAFASDLDLE